MNTLPPHANNGNSPLIPAASGIYKITCTVTKKFYIGSAINLQYRRRDHFNGLRRGDHRNSKLQHAFNKYGEQYFTFEVLELVLPMSLTAREQYWFNKLKPFGNKGFNIAHEAGSCLGRKLSPESCAKIGRASLGRKPSPEHQKKMTEQARQANLGRKRSPEAREKMRQAKLGKKQSPEAIENARQSRWSKREEVN